MIWLTSDHHFNHANIIKYTCRPFACAHEMDDELVRAWNRYIDPGDAVYHLGDFCFGDTGTAMGYFARLNGSIQILDCPFHHDGMWLSGYRNTDPLNTALVSPIVVLRLPEYGSGKWDMKLTLSHYPMESWEAKYYGCWHVHGHLHGKKDADRIEAVLDVGVDNAYRLFGEYRPFSIEDVARLIRLRTSPRD